MSVEGPRCMKAELHIGATVEVRHLRVGQKVLVWDDFASDSQKPMWMVKGDKGKVTSVDEEGDALILFPGKDPAGKSLSTIIRKKNFDKLRCEVTDAVPAKVKVSSSTSACSVVPRRILACGDALGNLAKLFAMVEAQASKVGAFDAVFCVGAFLPACGSQPVGTETSALSAFLTGGKKVPSPTYLVDSNPALLQAAPGGVELCEGLHFLGGYGLRDVCGLRVAFLSGSYDGELYKTPDAEFVGGAFTCRAVNALKKLVDDDPSSRGIDVLLTCAWPAELDERIEDLSQAPMDPDDSRPSWKTLVAPPITELCIAIEPRYHIFGGADLFYQRPPFQVPKRDHVCRCIALGNVGSTSKQRKWLHALSLSPMHLMRREDLMQLPANTTPCPFKISRKRPAKDLAGDEPAPKRGVVAEIEDGLRARAAEALLAGDLLTLQDIGAQLRASPIFIDRAGSAQASLQAVVPVPTAHVEARPEQGAEIVEKQRETSEEKKLLSEEERRKQEAAQAWLEKEPKKGVVRYTFRVDGPLGLRFSKDVPPWILEVKDGSLAAKKAPRVPLGGIVLAVNGYDLSTKDCHEAMMGMKSRPVVLDIEWPADQGVPPVCRA